MNSDILIVIQGPTSHLQQQKQVWKDFSILFSTWKGCESFYNDDDNVIFNNFPLEPGPANFWLQQHSTMNGLLKAKDLGYQYCLKLRSDLIPTNPHKFLSCLDKEKLNFLCWHNHEVYPKCSGYFVDYLMAGPLDILINLWDIKKIFCSVPEIMLTANFIKKCNNTDINYFLHNLNLDNDLFWIKNNLYLSTYKKTMSTDPYKKFNFSNNLNFLNNEYLSFLKS